MRLGVPAGRLAGAAVLVLVLAAAGPWASSAPPARRAAVRTVVLDFHYSRFSVSSLTLHRGQTVRFVVRNRDPIPHELIVGDQATQDRHEHGTEAHHGERPGEISVPAGGTAETDVTMGGPGRVWFGCHLPGHWAYGMRGTITIR